MGHLLVATQAHAGRSETHISQHLDPHAASITVCCYAPESLFAAPARFLIQLRLRVPATKNGAALGRGLEYLTK